MASKVIDLVNQNSNIVIKKNGQSSDLSLFLLLHTCQLLMLAPKQMLVSLHIFYFSGGQIGTQIGAQIGLANVFIQPQKLQQNNFTGPGGIPPGHHIIPNNFFSKTAMVLKLCHFRYNSIIHILAKF